MTWTIALLHEINQADDLKIAPYRADGKTHGTPTWIWEVVVDKRLFVRAYSGTHSSWYQSAIMQRAGIIQAAGQTFNVQFAPITDVALNDKIDAAYRDKYNASIYMKHMIGNGCRAATIEIVPQS